MILRSMKYSLLEHPRSGRAFTSVIFVDTKLSLRKIMSSPLRIITDTRPTHLLSGGLSFP